MFEFLRRRRETAGSGRSLPFGGGPSEVKSVINPVIALQGFAAPGWCEGTPSGLAREGYLKNAVVHRSVRMIAEAAASIPFLLFESDRELSKHPLLDLLTRPNPAMGGQRFMETLYANLTVFGNAYIHRLTLDGTPRELHLLRPDRVQLVLGEGGWPEAFDHTVNGTRTRYPAGNPDDPVLHLATYHPLADFEGFSPLGAAHMALDIHNAASAWNKALLDNSARPSGALVYATKDSSNLTDTQFGRLKSELEDGYSGASRAGRPMLLEGGLDWKPMGLSPKDMDFMEARNGAARDIALAFGIPPMLLGIPGDNTYANFQEANRAFWRQTVLPLVTRTASDLETWLASGSGLRLAIDKDAIEALSADREALWRRVNEAAFLTRNEKRAATGYGEAPDADE